MFQKLVDDDLTVSWMFEQTGVPEPTDYEFLWRDKTNDGSEAVITLQPPINEYTIPNIDEDVEYEIRVVAIYDDDRRYVGRTNLQLGVPRKPKVGNDPIEKTSTSIRLRWKQTVKTGKNHWPVDGYELTWRVAGSGSPVKSISLGEDVREHLIDGLLSGTSYDVFLLAKNGLGNGVSLWMPVTTDGVAPTPTPTPTASPKPTPTESTRIRSRSNRDTDPDPPEEFDAEQGGNGIVIYWDEPRWDGGSDILAYAVDWRPESPPFPLFLPPNEESTWIYGLKPDINYRMRVRAFNQKDDSLPATLRIKLTDTLVRRRGFAPFTGSISNGRSTVLENSSELPGFEIQADSKTLFWGDEMAFSIQRHPLDDEHLAELTSQQFAVVSDLFTVVATPHSRRTRFDNDATSYQFVTPVVICITPKLLNSAPIYSYSIIQIDEPSNIRVFDSSPVQDDADIKICARIREIDVNGNVTFAVISNQLALQANADSTQHKGGGPGNVAIALLMFVVGPTLILGGVTVLRRSPPPPVQST